MFKPLQLMRKLTHVFWLCLVVPLLLIGNLARAQTITVTREDGTLAFSETGGTIAATPTDQMTKLCAGMTLIYQGTIPGAGIANGDNIRLELVNQTTNTMVLNTSYFPAPANNQTGAFPFTIPTGLANGQAYYIRVREQGVGIVAGSQTFAWEFRNTSVSVTANLPFNAPNGTDRNIFLCFDDAVSLTGTVALQGSATPTPVQGSPLSGGCVTCNVAYEWRRDPLGTPTIVSAGVGTSGIIPTLDNPGATEINNISSDYTAPGGYYLRATETRYGSQCPTVQVAAADAVGLIFSPKLNADANFSAKLTGPGITDAAGVATSIISVAGPIGSAAGPATNLTVCNGSVLTIAIDPADLPEFLPGASLPPAGTPWAIVGPGGAVISTGTYPAPPSATFNINTLGAGNYSLIIGYNAATGSTSCGAAATYNITRVVRPQVTGYTQTGLNPMCEGQTLQIQGTVANANAGSTYQWFFNGTMIAASAVDAFTGETAATLQIGGSSVAGTPPYATAANTGPYFVRVSNGFCASTNETVLNVTVNAKPTGTAITFGKATYCEGETILMTASATSLVLSYTWAGPNGFASNNQFPTIPNATTDAAGVYSVTVASIAGCTASAFNRVSVNPKPTVTAQAVYTAGIVPGITHTGDCAPVPMPVTQTEAACAGGVVNLSANVTGGTTPPAYTFTWNGPAFTSNVEDPALSASGTTALNGVYTVKVVDGVGCSATATTQVTVLPLPAAQATFAFASGSSICEGGNAAVEAAPFGMDYQWCMFGASAGGGVLGGTKQRDPVFQGITIPNGPSSSIVWFGVIVTGNNGCAAGKELSIKVHQSPDFNLALSTPPYCAGGTATITLNETGVLAPPLPGDVLEYSWVGPARSGIFTTLPVPPGTVVTTMNNLQPVDGGTYSFVVRNNSCSLTHTTSLSVLHHPNPTIASTSPICSGTPISLSATTGIPAAGQGVGNITYSWRITGFGPALSFFPLGLKLPPVVPTTLAVGAANTYSGLHPDFDINAGYATYTYDVEVINTDPNNPANRCSNLTGPPAIPIAPPIIPNPTTTIRVNRVPTVAFQIPAGPKCTGDALDIRISDGIGDPFSTVDPLTSRNWNLVGPGIPATNGTFSSDAVAPNSVSIKNIAAMSLNDSGTYTVTVSNGACTNTATTSITIYTTPTASLSSNQPVCSGAPLTLITTTGLPSAGKGVASTVLYTYHYEPGGVMPGDTKYTPNGNAPIGPQAGPADGNTITIIAPTPVAVYASPTYNVIVDNGGCTYNPAAIPPLGVHPESTNTTVVNIVRTPASVALSGPTTPTDYCSGTPLVLNIIADESSIDPQTTFTITRPNGTIVSGTLQGLVNFPLPGGLQRFLVTVVENKQVSDSGTYTVVVTNSKGAKSCSATNSVIVNIRQTPKPSATVPVNFICSGTSVSITVNDAASYPVGQAPTILWFLTDPTMSLSPQAGPPSLNPVLPPAVPGAVVGPAITVGTYSLAPFDPFNVVSNQNVLKIENVQTGIGLFAHLPLGTQSSNYGFVVTLNNQGCINEAYANVTVVETPNIKIVNAPPTRAFCEGALNPFVIEAEVAPQLLPANQTYLWSGPAGFTSTVVAPTVPGPMTLAKNGVYSVTAWNKSNKKNPTDPDQICTATATVSLLVGKTPAPVVSAVTPKVCSGQTITLSVVDSNPAPGSSVTNWFLIDPTGPFTGPQPFNPVTSGDDSDADVFTPGIQSIAIGNYLLGASFEPFAVTDNTSHLVMTNAQTGLGALALLPPGVASSVNYGFRVRMSGVYSVTGGDPLVCTGTSDIRNVVVAETPNGGANVTDPAVGGNVKSLMICEGGEVDFSASAGPALTNALATFHWSGPAGFTSSLRQPFILNVTPANSGVYSVTVANLDYPECNQVYTVSVFVGKRPEPSIAILTPQICEGQAITLNGSDAAGTGSTYEWFMVQAPGFAPIYPGDTFPVVAGPNIDSDPLVPGLTPIAVGAYAGFSAIFAPLFDATSNGAVLNLTNTSINFPLGNIDQINWGFRLRFRKTYTSAVGEITCTAQSTVANIVINAGPGTVTLTATPDAICEGANGGGGTAIQFNLTRSGSLPYADATYKWAGPAGFTSSDRNPSINGPVTIAMNGVYSVTMTNPNKPDCSSTATVSVLVGKRPQPVVTATTPTVCSGSSIMLSVTDPNGVGATPNWWVVDPDGAGPLEGPNPLVPVTDGTDVDSNPFNGAGPADPMAIGDYVGFLSNPLFKPFSVLDNGSTLKLTNAQTGLGIILPAGVAPSVNYGFRVRMSGVYNAPGGGVLVCTGTSNVANVVVAETPAASVLTNNSPVCVTSNANNTASNPPLLLTSDEGPGLTPIGATYAWTSPNGYTSASQNPSVSPVTTAMSGVWTLSVKNVTYPQCSSTATTNVTINPMPSPVITITSSPVCAGGAASFSIVNGLGSSTGITWTVTYTTTPATATQGPTTSGGASFVTTNVGTASVTANALVGGCYATASAATLTIRSTPLTGISGASYKTAAVGVCEGVIVGPTNPIVTDRLGIWAVAGGQATAAADGGFASGTSFTWAGPGGPGGASFSSNTAFPTLNNGNGVTVANQGTYTVTISNGSGLCSATQTVFLKVGKKPVVTASAPVDIICTGSSITLLANDEAGTGGVGRWFLIDGVELVGYPGNPSSPVTAGAASNMGGPDGSIADGGYNLGTPSQVFYANLVGSSLTLTNAQIGLPGYPLMNFGFQYGVAAVYDEPTGNNEFFQCTTVSPIVNVAVSQGPSILGLAVAGNNQCAGQNANYVGLELAVNPTPAALSFKWAGPNGFSSLAQNPLIANVNGASTAQAGIYTVTVVNTAAALGCSATATVSVAVKAQPTATITGALSICEGSVLSLSASGGVAPETYAWTGSFGFASSAANIVIPGLGAGGPYTYSVVVTKNGCTSGKGVSVFVNPNPLTGVGNGGLKGARGYWAYNQDVCLGGTVFIGVSSRQYAGNEPFSDGTTFTWAGPNGYSSNSQAPAGFTALNASAGIYSVTIANGSCSATASLSVHVKALPTASATPNPVLQGNTFCLSVTGGEEPYSWRGPVQVVQIPSLFQTVTSPSFFAPNPLPGAFLAVYTDPAFVNALPHSSGYVWTGGYSLFYSGPIPGNGDYFIQYEFENDQFDNVRFKSKEKEPCRDNATPDMAGIYTVYANGCTATVNVKVTTIPPPSVVASASPSVVTAVGSTSLSATITNGPATSIAWAGPCGFSSASQNPTVSGLVVGCGGIYSVTVTAAGGTASATVSVQVNAPAPPPPPPTADLMLNMDSQTRKIVSGDNSYITVLVNNVGPNAASNVVVQTVLPAGFTMIPPTAVLPPPGADTNPLTQFGNPSQSGQIVTGTIANIPVGGTGIVKFYYKAIGPVGYHPNVTASVTSSSAIDPTAANDAVDVLFIASYGARVSAGSESTPTMKLKTYPNPSSDRVIVELELDEPAPAFLKLTDVTGRTVGEWKLEEVTTRHRTEISVREYNAGMYFLNAEAGDKRVNQRVVKTDK